MNAKRISPPPVTTGPAAAWSRSGLEMWLLAGECRPRLYSGSDDGPTTRQRIQDFIGSLFFLDPQQREPKNRPFNDPPDKKPNRPAKG